MTVDNGAKVPCLFSPIDFHIRSLGYVSAGACQHCFVNVEIRHVTTKNCATYCYIRSPIVSSMVVADVEISIRILCQAVNNEEESISDDAVQAVFFPLIRHNWNTHLAFVITSPLMLVACLDTGFNSPCYNKLQTY